MWRNSVETRRYADLHIHSTASDGRLSPSAVVELAREKGFACIALADHDTVAGVEEALCTGSTAGVEVIPAVELSTLYDGGEVHVLGYFIDWRAQVLLEKLRDIMCVRENRARQMVEKLQSLGLEITWGDVRAAAGSSYVGRPHIAAALLNKGYISEPAEAFTDRFIGRNGPAYVERYEIDPADAMDLIRQSGGVAVLAHPGFFKNKQRNRLEERDIRLFMDWGLQGLEVYHTRHEDEDIVYYLVLAQKYRLAVTGGSDCHGGNGGEVLMGQVKLDYARVEQLRNIWRKGEISLTKVDVKKN